MIRLPAYDDVDDDDGDDDDGDNNSSGTLLLLERLPAPHDVEGRRGCGAALGLLHGLLLADLLGATLLKLALDLAKALAKLGRQLLKQRRLVGLTGLHHGHQLLLVGELLDDLALLLQRQLVEANLTLRRLLLQPDRRHL